MKSLFELVKDPGFVGSLLGAIITGVIAIIVWISQIRRENSSEKLIKENIIML